MIEDPLATQPEIPPATDFTPVTPATSTLESGGVEVWLVERSDLPLVSIRLVIDGGAAADPADQPGLAWLTDTMLTHGAGDRDANAFAAYIEQQAIELDVSTSSTASVVYLDTHADRLEEALDLLADAVLRPLFDAEELDRVRELQVGDILQALDEPGTIAPWVAGRLYYGEGHPLAAPNIGTPEGLAEITTADLRASWSSRYVASRAKLVVVGAVEEDDLMAALNSRFSDWSAGTPAALPPPPAGVSEGPSQFLVDIPGATQTALRVVMPGWSATDPARAAGELATIALGGTFTSRLNRLMREEKGYTYGARARASAAVDYGTVVASSSVQVDHTVEGLTDMLGELRRAAEGFTEEERTKAQGAYRTDVIESMGGRGSTAASLSQLLITQQPPDALPHNLAASASASVEEMTAAWAGRADLSGALVLVVGDLAAIQAPIEEAFPGTWTVVDKHYPLPE